MTATGERIGGDPSRKLLIVRLLLHARRAIETDCKSAIKLPRTASALREKK